MVLDPIPQSLPVHFFGSRPQPPTSPLDCYEWLWIAMNGYAWLWMDKQMSTLQHTATHCNTLQHTDTTMRHSGVWHDTLQWRVIYSQPCIAYKQMLTAMHRYEWLQQAMNGHEWIETAMMCVKLLCMAVHGCEWTLDCHEWSLDWNEWTLDSYGVAMTSRLLKIIGIFCKRAL